TQYVKQESPQSNTKLSRFGVPQGSILDPLVFLVYINDIVQVSLDATCFIFADDTNLLITRRNSAELQQKGQEALNSLTRWSHLNGLTMNKQKNQAIMFRCKN